jgi:MFS family permease
LKYPGFRFGIITVTIVSMGEFAIIFVLSIYFQVVRGMTAIGTGITFLPLAISVFFSAPVAGLLSSRFGPKWIVTTGMVLEALGLFTLSQIITVSTPIEYIYPVFAIYGVGVGLAIGQLTNTVLMSVPWQKAGVASGTNNTVRQVGSAFGVAVIGAVLVAQVSSVGQGAAIKTVFDAITQGTRSASLVAASFVSLGAVSSLLIPNAKPRIVSTKVVPAEQKSSSEIHGPSRP